jgi:CxxC motif-containing protein (DUF1111 family)
MKKLRLFIFCGLVVSLASVQSCKKETTLENPWYEPGEEMAGGVNTIELQSSSTFDTPSPALSAEELKKHRDGLAFFDGTFVTNPSTINGGLGPVFNANGCESCHVKNGRAPFPAVQNDLGGLLMRISDGYGAYGEPLDINGFGGQLQTKAVIGVQPEAAVNWIFENHTETFADGEVVNLRKPVFSILNPYISFPNGAAVSPRIAPPVFGLGLLEAIDENTMLAMADEFDSDQDGISGRANYVWDNKNNRLAIGKFGWKANQPHLYQQCARAFQQDMGVTSALYPSESCKDQDQDDYLNDDAELSDNDISLTAYYVQSLGAPKRRDADNATVLEGKQLFMEAKCGSCHNPKVQTGSAPDASFNSNQTIFPYTDLLLHDMGEGLADNRGDFAATGTEWRTPPLWGIGILQVVNGHSDLMHDGRARDLMEAILWHGGEAQQSKDYVKNLSRKDRDALLTFLKSL